MSDISDIYPPLPDNNENKEKKENSENIGLNRKSIHTSWIDLDTNKETYSHSNSLDHESNLKWRWVATRLLAIFMIIILVAGICIAAVPSWRNSFNRFIAKWSPKASEIETEENAQAELFQAHCLRSINTANSTINIEAPLRDDLESFKPEEKTSLGITVEPNTQGLVDTKVTFQNETINLSNIFYFGAPVFYQTYGKDNIASTYYQNYKNGTLQPPFDLQYTISSVNAGKTFTKKISTGTAEEQRQICMNEYKKGSEVMNTCFQEAVRQCGCRTIYPVDNGGTRTITKIEDIIQADCTKIGQYYFGKVCETPQKSYDLCLNSNASRACGPGIDTTKTVSVTCPSPTASVTVHVTRPKPKVTITKINDKDAKIKNDNGETVANPDVKLDSDGNYQLDAAKDSLKLKIQIPKNQQTYSLSFPSIDDDSTVYIYPGITNVAKTNEPVTLLEVKGKEAFQSDQLKSDDNGEQYLTIFPYKAEERVCDASIAEDKAELDAAKNYNNGEGRSAHCFARTATASGISKIKVTALDDQSSGESEKSVNFEGSDLDLGFVIDKEKNMPCGTLDKTSEEQVTKVLDEPEKPVSQQPTSMENKTKSWLVQTYNKTKNNFVSFMGLKNKALSQDNDPTSACACVTCMETELGSDAENGGYLAVPKESIKFTLRIKNNGAVQKNLDVYAEIPEYFMIVDPKNATLEDNKLKWHIDKLDTKETKNLEFVANIAQLNDSSKLPPDGKIIIKSHYIKDGQTVPGKDFTANALLPNQDPEITIYKIKRPFYDEKAKVIGYQDLYADNAEDHAIPKFTNSKGDVQYEIFPGDRVYYQANLKNPTAVSNVDMLARYSDAASDYGEMLASGDDKSLKGSDQDYQDKKIIYKHFNKINSGEDKIWTYWIQLPDDVDLKYTLIGTWAKMGQVKVPWALWGKPNGVILSDLKLNWLRNDLFGFVEGKITGADNKPVPKININLQSVNTYNYTDTVITKEYKQDNKTYQKLFSDENGNYFLEFNRNKDLKSGSTLSANVQLKSYKQTSAEEISTNSYSLIMAAGNTKDGILGFDYALKNIGGNKISNNNIEVLDKYYNFDSGGSMPILTIFDSNFAFRFKKINKFDAVKSGLNIFTNLVNAKDYLADNFNSLEDKMPENVVFLDENYNWASANGKNIHFGLDFFQYKENRSPQTVLHEFAHTLMYSLYGGSYPSSDLFYSSHQNIPDKMPYSIINQSHWGSLNDTTSASYSEGFADFMQVYLHRAIESSFNSWEMQNEDRTVARNLETIYPLSALLGMSDTHGDINPDIDFISYEETGIAEMLKELGTGFPQSYQRLPLNWLAPEDRVNSIINVGYSNGNFDNAALGNIFNIMKDGKPNTLTDFLIYAKRKFNENKIDGLSLLHANFHDTNCDNIYQHNETVGQPAEDCGYKLTNIPLVTYGQDGAAKFQITTLLMGARYWRNLPPVTVPGSYIKFDFKNTSDAQVADSKVKVDIQFAPPYEQLNYSNEYKINDGELVYVAMPFSIYNAKAVVTAEGSGDSFEVSSDKYWPAMNSNMYDYFAEKTFTIGGTTPIKNSAPQIDTPNSAGGGDSVNINVGGLNNSSKADVYIGDKKVADNIPLLSGNFGLELDIPTNINLGSQEIKIQGDKGEIATTKIRITSNKWFNKYIIFSAVFIIFMFFLMIFIYKTIRDNIMWKNKITKPISAIMIIIFTVAAFSLIFYSVDVSAYVNGVTSLVEMEGKSLKDTVITTDVKSNQSITLKQNLMGFIRLPQVDVRSQTEVIDPVKFYGTNVNESAPMYQKWGKPKTIRFIGILSKQWYDINIDYYTNTMHLSEDAAREAADSNKLIINDMSLANGNDFGHMGHTNGLDIDLWTATITRYAGTEQRPYLNHAYDPVLAQKFADLVNSHKNDFGVNVINHTQDSDEKEIKGITNIGGHRVHWHVGLK